MTHAFFKALLFLSAGAIIISLHHEQNMFRMGGLRKLMPVVFWTFLIGSASLAALPLITAGFYSKDQILWYSLAGERGNFWLYLAGLFGAFITGVYTFRMVFITFFGEPKTHVSHPPSKIITVPLVILAVLSLVSGFIELPHNFGHVTIFSDFLTSALPAISVNETLGNLEWLFQLLAVLVSLTGVYLAYLFFLKKPALQNILDHSGLAKSIHSFWFSGWGFDKLYDLILVRPFVYLATINKNDIIDKIYTAITTLARAINRGLAQTQSGILRWYMMGIVVGALLIITLSLLP